MALSIGNNYSDYLTKSNSVKPQVASSENSANASSPHLNTHEVKFVMENGMATGAMVDGIKMDISDLILTNKSQLKERINEKYNKTDAEKLIQIFEL